jgi:hypothetical protein
MQQKSIWDYIWVGTCLRYLQDQGVGWKAKGDGRTCENLETFLNCLIELELHVTKRASGEFEVILDELKAKDAEFELTDDYAKRISKAASEIRMTFEAETRGVFTYVVTDKRMDVRKLLSGIDELFAPETFDALPDFARYDFTESGKCIAFERPTAAAFHVLRGTESVLRSFYKRYVRPAQSGLTWGQMTNALTSKSKGKKPDHIVLQNLDHIRVSFRNPTQHPDKIYDIQESQELFSLCIESVNRMIVAIKEVKPNQP